jgi:hypothetical protein
LAGRAAAVILIGLLVMRGLHYAATIVDAARVSIITDSGTGPCYALASDVFLRIGRQKGRRNMTSP